MPAPHRSLIYYLALGLIQGLILLALYELRLPLLTATLGTAALIAILNLQLLGTAVKERGTWLLVLAQTAVMAAIGAWLHDRESSDWLWRGWTLGGPALAYICTAFTLAWPQREGWRPRYPDLFQHAWNNAFIVALAGFLCGLFMLLLWLCGGLFKMLHLPQLADLFDKPPFLFITLPVVFSVGMRMGCENERVIGLLRGILLTLCRFLLPLGALIAVLFTAALPFTGVQPIWDTGYSTTILLCLVGVLLFLINGVFQDGDQQTYPQALRRLVEASILCLPVLVALAGWSTWLRVEQYGLMPARILAMLYVLVAMLHSLALVWAVFASRGGWLVALRGSNVVLALFNVVLIVLFFSPLLDPMGRSAKDQMQRLQSGRTAVEDFDVGAFRYRLGVDGKAQLQALKEQLERGEGFSEADRKVLLERLSDYDLERGGKRRPKLEWLGAEAPGSEQFVDVLSDVCRVGRCVLWPVDLDADGRNEVVVISTRRHAGWARFYRRDDAGSWEAVGRLSGFEGGGEALLARIREGKVKVVTPRYRTLQIDGKDLNLSVEP